MNRTPSTPQIPTPVSARDPFGAHFPAELDQMLTDWLDGLDDAEFIRTPGLHAA
jgi:hypothetical protein